MYLRIYAMYIMCRLLGVLGRYATSDDRKKHQAEENPSDLFLNALMNIRNDAKSADSLQIVAASATVGRPLRREIC